MLFRSRTKNAAVLIQALQGIEGIRVPEPAGCYSHAYYRLTALFDDDHRREKVVKLLQLKGIPSAVGPCPEIYLDRKSVV